MTYKSEGKHLSITLDFIQVGLDNQTSANSSALGVHYYGEADHRHCSLFVRMVLQHTNHQPSIELVIK